MRSGIALSLQEVGMAYKYRVGFMRYEKAWALQSVNFEVMSGETLGIIGRNGAGKSSLL